MARSRNIKPGFFTNEELAECSFAARLLFAGLWTLADREGRLEDRPKRIRAALFPYEYEVDADKLLMELEEHEFIVRYEADGRACIWITGFHKNQRPHHMEEPSQLPPAPGSSNRFNHSPITKAQRHRIFERDDHKCLECGSSRQLQIDHIIPVSKGGSSEDSNLRTLCRKCNEKKGNRDQIENDLTSIQREIESQCATVSVTRNQESGIRNQESGRGRANFEPPTVADVAAYCAERLNGIDAESFVAYYASKGWKVGKSPMKDWHSAIVTWEKNKGNYASNGSGKQRPRVVEGIAEHDPK